MLRIIADIHGDSAPLFENALSNLADVTRQPQVLQCPMVAYLPSIREHMTGFAGCDVERKNGG